MRLFDRLPAALGLALGLGACTLAPTYHRPDLPVSSAWPVATSDATSPSDAPLPAWKEMFPDPRLQSLISLALSQNRDLRIAVGNIQKARAQAAFQHSALLPDLALSGGESRSRTPASVSPSRQAITSTAYSAALGFTAYELDLFGRVRSLGEAARQSWRATAEDRRTVQISLIAQVAADDLQLAADLQLQDLARETFKARGDSLRIIRLRADHGAASGLDLAQAEGLEQQARSALAAADARVEQDRNALRLVVGADIPKALEPVSGVGSIRIMRTVPVGLPSTVLTRRPDVLSAEHLLRAQNADIAAARAAFLPQISLTGSAGQESAALGGLFDTASRSWSFAPKITLPIFDGGAHLASLDIARAGRRIAVAQYEKAIQTAFREVADALAVRAVIADELDAQSRQVVAAQTALTLSQARYDRGLDPYLQLLDAQRSLYVAQQTLVATELAEVSNRLILYKALGGGGDETSAR